MAPCITTRPLTRCVVMRTASGVIVLIRRELIFTHGLTLWELVAIVTLCMAPPVPPRTLILVPLLLSLVVLVLYDSTRVRLRPAALRLCLVTNKAFCLVITTRGVLNRPYVSRLFL